MIANAVYNWYTYSIGCSNAITEKPSTKPSLTVPGMTMSLEELLKRYVRGDSVTTFTPVYVGDDDMPDIASMTEMDKIDLARDLQSGIEIVRNRKTQKPEPLPVPEPAPAPTPEPAPSK